VLAHRRDHVQRAVRRIPKRIADPP
jgi:hypothetical protein